MHYGNDFWQGRQILMKVSFVRVVRNVAVSHPYEFSQSYKLYS